MLGDRITIPTKEGLVSVRVVKLKRSVAVVELVDSETEFTLPLELLPKNVEMGDRLNLKILDPTLEEENHTIFAQRLLEEIMN